MNKNFSYFLRIAGVLTLICSIVALLVSFVDMVTEVKIEENEQIQKKEAVSAIFTDMTDALPYTTGGNDIFLVMKDQKLYGYCANVTTEGYGGTIQMMVGVDYAGAVRGVKIVTMSETPGLGSKTGSDDFLAQYASATPPFTVGGNIDAVSGATVSSRAVTAGVNKALELGISLNTIAAQEGYSLYGAEETTVAEAESTEETTVLSNVPAVTIETEAPDGTNISSDMVGSTGYKPPFGKPEEDKTLSGAVTEGYYIEKETTDTTIPEETADTAAETTNSEEEASL